MDIRYIAGLFDGEGSVGIYPTGNGKRAEAPSSTTVYWTVNLSIAGTHRPMIDEVVKHIHGATFIGDTRLADQVAPNGKRYAQGHHRPSFKAQLRRKTHVEVFLRAIRPFLWEKAEQVDIVLRWIAGELDGEAASTMCKAAKRFKFDNPGAVTVRKRWTDHGVGSPNARFTAEQAENIRTRVVAGERPGTIAKELGVSNTQVWRLVRGGTYKNCGGATTHTATTRRVLTTEQAHTIRTRFAAGEQQAALAREYGVSTTTMNRIALGRSYAT